MNNEKKLDYHVKTVIDKERSLRRSERTLLQIEQDIPLHPSMNEVQPPSKHIEIILNPELPRIAGKVLVAGVCTGGGLTAAGAGIWAFLKLTAIGGAAIAANITGIRYGIAGLSVVAIIFLASKIKTRTRVEYRDNGTTINKTYNQYNDCRF